MASIKSRISACKPVTRKETDIWLVCQQLSSTLGTSKLPSKQKVLALFFYYKEVEEKTVRDASHCNTEDVMKVWDKASIPTTLKKHVLKKVKEMFKEWAKLKNKAKRCEELHLKETKWQEQLKGLFDIAHAEAMNIITIEEDKKFLLAKRETCRPGLIGAVDMALHTQQARSQKRQKSFERRKAEEEKEKI